jgi:hypothetical protein
MTIPQRAHRFAAVYLLIHRWRSEGFELLTSSSPLAPFLILWRYKEPRGKSAREGFSMRLRVLVLTAALLLWPVSVFSETPELDLTRPPNPQQRNLDVDTFVSGNELFRICHDSAQGDCRAYVMGVTDSFMVANALKASGLAIPSFCPPKGHLVPEQVRDIVVQYLTAHPATRHTAATHEALAALQAAFPCK